jgi:alkaline phosphatase D
VLKAVFALDARNNHTRLQHLTRKFGSIKNRTTLTSAQTLHRKCLDSAINVRSMRLLPRRRFLELSLVSAGAALGPVACSSDATSAPQAPLDSTVFFPQSVASGDPRPSSVVLWTRVVDADHLDVDYSLTLELATDEAFTQLVSLDGGGSRELSAQAAFDHCVKTLVSGLDSATTYYYRFSYVASAGTAVSRVGRTKTAPADDADVSVRFAVVSCQDYAGKYYHAYRHLATLEVDVIVHLGDYIYETTSDPSFQVNDPNRAVVFGKPNEALSFGSGDTQYQAAQSLDNYRDLYRLYRSDLDLQAAHERFPMVAVQDDHEFSDDCHADVATYTDGRTDETETPRRLAADQAWFEYMPVDLSQAPTSDWDAAQGFPGELRYYRRFVYGQHLELVLTDLRRYRPDHLVPEDAFPGAVFLEQTALTQLLGALPDDAVPYVTIDDYASGAYQKALQNGADTLGILSADVTGSISVPYINGALTTLGLTKPAQISLDTSDLELGYAYHQLLKTDQFSRIGSRYVVALGPFNALAQAKYQASSGVSEQLMGKVQRAWFLETMKASTRTFKVWGSEVCLMPRHVDLTPVTLAPDSLRTKISISAEDWDGFPNERQALLTELAALSNVVIVSGDLHCFFAGTPYVEGDVSQRVVEFVTGSLTSTTWKDGLVSLVDSDPSLPPETKLVVDAVGTLLVDPTTRPNPHLAFQNLAENGYGVCEVDGDRLAVTLYSVSSKAVATAPDELTSALDDLFTEQAFEVAAGAPDLFRSNSGARERWDIASMSWVAAS